MFFYGFCVFLGGWLIILLLSTPTKPLDRGLHVNGKLTLSENIADVAGVSSRTTATARRSATGERGRRRVHGRPALLHRLRQAWRSKERPEILRTLVMVDGHAPGQYRAAAVRNVDAWYRAFDVKAGREALPGSGGAHPGVVSRGRDEPAARSAPRTPPRSSRSRTASVTAAPRRRSTSARRGRSSSGVRSSTAYPPQPVRACEAFVPARDAGP
jgi:hypothetical protein